MGESPRDTATPRGTYTTKQLADLAGVSVRTLRHYDRIGLLVPNRRDNGFRAYSPAEVERLQQVLLLRDSGMALADIRRTLDSSGYDVAETLEAQVAQLIARRRELDRTIACARRTIRSIREGETMTDEERFEGLKRGLVEDNERAYGHELRERFGDEATDAANARLMDMSEERYMDTKDLEARVEDALRSAMATNDTTGPEAQRLCELHAEWLRRFWAEGSYSPQAHAALAEGYLADDRFRAHYDDACGEGATRFLRDAIVSWCSTER